MKKTIFTLVMLAFIGLSTANAQVGIGTTSPDGSAILDVVSTEKGFLPPRMSTAERNVINGGSPAEGLVIYNLDINCLQWWDGSVWYNACDGSSTGIIPNNATCETATISSTPCSAVPGATLNDDSSTADGTEYDWADAPSYMSGGTTQALIEIGGQCWFKRNTIASPTAPIADAPNTGANVWLNTNEPDNGYWGYYNTVTTDGSNGWGTTEPAVGEGLLYQWSAAMNGSTEERAQGVCPTGWHVPSDCEWMYLENSLGMTTTEQESTSFRGTQGQDLSNLTSGGTNSSGFTGLLSGGRNINGSFTTRGNRVHWWTSSDNSSSPSPQATRRVLDVSEQGVQRQTSSSKADGYFVRCLKD